LLLYGSNYAALINVINLASCNIQVWFLALGFIGMSNIPLVLAGISSLTSFSLFCSDVW
jgi:hypothetical protein